MFLEVMETHYLEKIRAHKYILISGSPVFWSMFQGELREDKDVEVTDVEPRIFIEMLKFLYYEEVTITGDNVMQILYMSKKYMIPSLGSKCTSFLGENLDIDNVCVILEQSIVFNDQELQKTCLKIFQGQTENILNSDGFKRISREALMKILDMNELDVKEVEILKAANDWAKHHIQNESETRWVSCGQNESETVGKFDGQSLRKQLGAALYKIRFTQMSFEEFGDLAVSAGILTQYEENLCFRYFCQSTKPDNIPFETKPRKIPKVIFTLQCESVLCGLTECPQNKVFKLKNKSNKTLELRGMKLTVDASCVSKVFQRANHLRGWAVVDFTYSETNLFLANTIKLEMHDCIEIKVLFKDTDINNFISGVYDSTKYSKDDITVLLTPCNHDLIPVTDIFYEENKW